MELRTIIILKEVVNLSRIAKKILAVALAATLLFTGCGGKSKKESSSAAPPKPVVSADSAQQAGTPQTQNYSSANNGVSFDYPGDWSVAEDGNILTLSSPADLNSGIIIVDVSYEVSLFLAGHGDMEDSIDALVDKYVDIVTGDSPAGNYNYNWDQAGNGDIRANASFTYSDSSGNSQGVVDVEQLGSRVFLSIWLSPDDDRKAQINAVYSDLNGSFSATGTGGTLEPADLSDLGFPEAPGGFYRFYSPVTGQFFIYPDDWNLVSDPHDNNVILFNDKGAVMLTENWTKPFYERYNSNGNDEEECFDEFLNECADALESIYGETPRYSSFQYMATENQELIKATFNYTVSAGTGRCFAEFGVRPKNGTDYIQATLCLYKPGDSYSIDLFSIIMDSTVITYPEL